MLKRILAAVTAVSLVMSVSSCSIDDNTAGKTDARSNTTTQKETRIHNNFKDVLPEFKFDGEPVEKYEEGLSYTFSAECSESNYEKYIRQIKKAGFENKPVEANGYYAAYNAENYFVEITLVGDYITVFTKRT